MTKEIKATLFNEHKSVMSLSIREGGDNDRLEIANTLTFSKVSFFITIIYLFLMAKANALYKAENRADGKLF